MVMIMIKIILLEITMIIVMIKKTPVKVMMKQRNEEKTISRNTTEN